MNSLAQGQQLGSKLEELAPTLQLYSYALVRCTVAFLGSDNCCPFAKGWSEKSYNYSNLLKTRIMLISWSVPLSGFPRMW